MRGQADREMDVFPETQLLPSTLACSVPELWFFSVSPGKAVKQDLWILRDGSEEPVPTYHLLTICNFSSSGSDAPFWPPWALGTDVVHRHPSGQIISSLKNKTKPMTSSGSLPSDGQVVDVQWLHSITAIPCLEISIFSSLEAGDSAFENIIAKCNAIKITFSNTSRDQRILVTI